MAAPDVGERHISILVHDLSVKRILNCLTETMHISWKEQDTQSKGDDKVYVVYRSLKDIATEEWLVAKSENAFRQGMETAMAALSTSESELNRIAESNPLLASRLRSPSGRAALQLLAGLSPGQRQDIYDGVKVQTTIGQLPTGSQRYLGQMLTNSIDPSAGAEDDSNKHLTGEETLTFRRVGFGPSSVVNAGVDRKGYAKSVGLGGFIADPYRDDKLIPELSAEDHRLSRLPVMVASDIKAKSSAELLDLTAQELRVNIIAEHFHDFGQPDRLFLIREGKTTVADILDKNFVPVWWKRGNVYLLQHKYWFLDQQFEVPDDLIAAFERRRKEESQMGFQDWVSMGKLRPQQWMALQSLEFGEFDQLLDRQEVLAFFANLDRTQQEAILSKNGMSCNGLQKHDEKRLKLWINRHTFDKGDLPSKVTLRVRASDDVQGTRFKAIAVLTDGSERVLCDQVVPGRQPTTKQIKN